MPQHQRRDVVGDRGQELPAFVDVDPAGGDRAIQGNLDPISLFCDWETLKARTQAVLDGQISAGHLGETVVYVIILVASVAVLAEVYGDLLRAAGATERLMELLVARSPIASPARPAALPAVQGGSSVRLEGVTFHYPSRPAHPALRRA